MWLGSMEGSSADLITMITNSTIESMIITGPMPNTRGRWKDFYKTFNRYHPYMAFSMCIFGLISNMCLIGVLSRPRMRSTVNRLLTSIASIDMALMLSYSLYLAHFHIGDRHRCPVHMFTYEWTVFQLFHANFSVYARACTLWLSATVAGYSKHVVTLATPVHYENPKLAIRLTGGVALAVMAASAPIFLQNSAIREGPRAPENDTTCPANHSPYYVLQAPDFAHSSPTATSLLSKITFMMNGIILKFLPCMLLAYFLAFLVYALYAHKRWRADKFMGHRRSSVSTSGSPRGSVLSNQSSAPTTLILTTILCTTLLCELPNAILSLICSLSNIEFIKEVYVNLGLVLDLLSLFSCTSTSILYCVMSHLFRDTFFQLFFPRRFSSFSNGTRNRHDVTNVTAATVPRSRSASPSNIITPYNHRKHSSADPYYQRKHSPPDDKIHMDTLQPLLLGTSIE